MKGAKYFFPAVLLLLSMLASAAACSTTASPGQPGTTSPAATSGSTNTATATTGTSPTPTAVGTKTPTPGSSTPAPSALFLTILEPADESIVAVNTITVKGRSLPDAIVSINGQPVDLDATGTFVVQETLDEGPNVFDIAATDGFTTIVSTQLVVDYSP